MGGGVYLPELLQGESRNELVWEPGRDCTAQVRRLGEAV